MLEGENNNSYNTPQSVNDSEDYKEYLDDRLGSGKCRDCGQELGAAAICPSCGVDNSSVPPFERETGDEN